MKKSISLTKQKLIDIILTTGEVCAGPMNRYLYEEVAKTIDDAKFKKILKNITRRSSHIESPVDIFGTTTLIEDIAYLSERQLHEVIIANKLDTTGTVRRWKDRARIEAFIIDAVQKRKDKGKVFR